MGYDPEWMHGKYPHIRIPKALLTSQQYAKLSPEAKLVYGVLMDRSSLSETKGNRFKNEKGETFVIYTQTELQDVLGCGHDKMAKVMRQLDEAGLIKRRRIGVGRPYEIVVVPMDWSMRKLRCDNPDIPQSGTGENRSPECGKKAGNNPDGSKPDYNPDGWAEKLIASCIHQDDLKKYYPESLVERLADSMAALFYVNLIEYQIGDLVLDVAFLRGMVLSLDQEQLTSALQRLQKRDAAQMTDSEILGVLYDIYREPLY